MKNKLRAVLESTIKSCFDHQLLLKTPLPDYVIEVPNNIDHGHFATNLPLQLASSQKRRPQEIASIIVDNIDDTNNLIESTQIAGPGFINFRIKAKEWERALIDIINQKEDYGRSPLGRGQSVLVEFVSANPTGPLHIGQARGAALGDTLCRILSFCGYDVSREYYINDSGQQIRLLGESIYSRLKQRNDPSYPFPEKGYHGDYVAELGEIISAETDFISMSEEEIIQICAEKGKGINLNRIKENLARFRVDFNIWHSENDLINSGQLQSALDTLSAKGQLYEQEDALWIKTSEFGDDKDRVIRKNDGQFTYFASDIAYHLNKWERGYDRAINLWGADHHGYVPRMMAALKAQEIPDDWLSIMLIQLAKLWKGDEEIKMSKRAGSYVTLQELLDEVGVDAARFVFLTKNHDSTLDFDIELVKKQNSDNPVYYVQYAHARICSIFRKAASEGISLPDQYNVHLEQLELESETALIRAMVEFPSLLEDICKALEPHRLTYYITDLASQFHKYFHLGTKRPEYRIVNNDPILTQTRLFLAEAVRIVINNGLRLLGVQAPEKM